jgi:lipopolysaccharide export system protein LptA
MTALSRSLLVGLLLGAAGPCLRAADTPATDTVVEAQSFDSQSTDHQTVSVFAGNVTATGNGMTITCDRLEVITLRGGSQTDIIGKQEQFKSLIATGNVRIVQGDREATCQRAEVLPGEDRITLTGNPMVVDHGNNTTATGEPLILYRGDRRVHGTNVRIVLPPLKNLGFDKNQPPPAPTIEAPKVP